MADVTPVYDRWPRMKMSWGRRCLYFSLMMSALLVGGFAFVVNYSKLPDPAIWTAREPHRFPHGEPDYRMLSQFKAALATFEIDNSRFPSTAEGLDALVNCPPGLEKTWTKELDAVPVDHWGTAFQYVGPESAPNGEYQIISAGPDKKFGTADDLLAR